MDTCSCFFVRGDGLRAILLWLHARKRAVVTQKLQADRQPPYPLFFALPLPRSLDSAPMYILDEVDAALDLSHTQVWKTFSWYWVQVLVALSTLCKNHGPIDIHCSYEYYLCVFPFTLLIVGPKTQPLERHGMPREVWYIIYERVCFCNIVCFDGGKQIFKCEQKCPSVWRSGGSESNSPARWVPALVDWRERAIELCLELV